MSAFLALAVVSASLHVTVWPAGPGHPSRSWTLHCNPTAGTLPRAAAACDRLARMTKPFAPVPRDVACTQIYGGPQTALVTGSFRGRSVRAHFNRQDGCQIARWDGVKFLFPVPVSPSP